MTETPVPAIQAARTLQYARALGLTEDQVAEVVRLHRESPWTWEQLRDRLPTLAMDLICGDAP